MVLPSVTTAQETGHLGLRVGQLFSHTELQDQTGLNAYVFMRGGLKRYTLLEMGVGFGQYQGVGYSTDVWLGELKVVHHLWHQHRVHPFFYIGTGLVWHNNQLAPPQATANTSKTGWTPIIPAGFGLQFPLTKHLRLEWTVGYTYTYRDDLDGAILNKGNDGFMHSALGLTFGTHMIPPITVTNKSKPPIVKVPVAQPADDDQDGLTNEEENNIYQTNPNQSDTDKDGLTDKEEVREFFTNPNMLDSDADGLIDSEEVRAYLTNPHLADTDADGLTDGQEVVTYRTDPLKADTDGDGVSDGQEVIKGRDPLKKDP